MLYVRGSQAIKAEEKSAVRRMQSLPDMVIDLLADGEVHSIPQIASGTKLPERQAEKVLNFLIRYGFAKKVGANAQIDNEFLALLGETR